MKITNDIKFVGVNDRKIEFFEGQFAVPNGMSYNSYVILDEKIAVMDTVDISFSDEWLSSLRSVLGDRSPHYLVIQHMEPDHSASIVSFVKAFPNAKIVSTAKGFLMMKQFFGTNFSEKQIVINDGAILCLGTHSLRFFTAPMVHWPEVFVTYDSYDRVLFSADGFGKFGAIDTDGEWACEARRYYFGIVGKYGAQVQNLLKKISPLEINIICPLHGPALKENLSYYLSLYHTWSSFLPEDSGIVIAYTSVYGNTKKAVLTLLDMLHENGCDTVVLHDLARADMSAVVEDAFRYDRLVLATTTYNGEIFPFMREFINHLTERSFQNRTVALIENGSWAPSAAKTMRKMLESSREICFTDTTVKITSALDEQSLSQLRLLSKELCNK